MITKERAEAIIAHHKREHAIAARKLAIECAGLANQLQNMAETARSGRQIGGRIDPVTRSASKIDELINRVWQAEEVINTIERATENEDRGEFPRKMVGEPEA